MNVGHNIGLSDAEVRQAIREFALTRAKSRGVVVPSIDSLDFQNRAAVHYTIVMVPGPPGPDGSPTQTPSVSAMTVWED